MVKVLDLLVFVGSTCPPASFQFLEPINLIIFQGSSLGLALWERSHLEGGFMLRCSQHLSLPHIATQLCPWQNNWYTSGASIPVLSY